MAPTTVRQGRLAPRVLLPILRVRASDVVASAPRTLELADLDAETAARLSPAIADRLARVIEERARAEWWRVAGAQPFLQMRDGFRFDDLELSTRARNALGRFPKDRLREATLDDLMEVPGLGARTLIELLLAFEGTSGASADFSRDEGFETKSPTVYPLAPRPLAQILRKSMRACHADAPPGQLADLDLETSQALAVGVADKLNDVIMRRVTLRWTEVDNQRAFPDAPLAFSPLSLPLSLRARNCIARAKACASVTIGDLMAIPNFGVTSLLEVLRVYEVWTREDAACPAQPEVQAVETVKTQLKSDADHALLPLAPRVLAPLLALDARAAGGRAAPPLRLARLDLEKSERLDGVLLRRLDAVIGARVANGWREVVDSRAFPEAEASFDPASLDVGEETRRVLEALPLEGRGRVTVGDLMRVAGMMPEGLLDVLRAYERENCDHLSSYNDATTVNRPINVRIKQMYELYEAGSTLEDLAREFGITRERVRQLFRGAGLPTRTVREAAALKNRRLMDIHRSTIIAAFENGEAVSAIVQRLRLPLSLVRHVIDEDPRRARVRSAGANAKRRQERLYADNELIDCLRTANLALGGILTTASYSSFARGQEFADGRPWPTHQTPALRFGSWRAALKKAGLEANPPSAIAGQRIFTREHCIDAILEVERELGHLPTAAEYERYVTRMGGALPSLATLRHRCGGWQQALKLAVAFE